MRLLGWCETCHHLRYVEVKVPMPGAVQVGQCDECIEECEEQKRKR